ncbi:hypothetical protein A4D02_19790 [Niastella koreensis]|uniref:Uncharacterized protein n=1 Tax=Niastella koreensis TaxID=354356 RepID=A0ABX3P6G6_9BACT|nr:hypothetical protein A4D02_19790 [Niastella koreensis]
MKKALFDITALLSFFIRISCKTKSIKSIQCKPGASRSRSAGPHIKISRAYKKIISTAGNNGVAKLRSTGCQMLNIWGAVFCDSSFVSAVAYSLEQ